MPLEGLPSCSLQGQEGIQSSGRCRPDFSLPRLHAFLSRGASGALGCVSLPPSTVTASPPPPARDQQGHLTASSSMCMTGLLGHHSVPRVFILCHPLFGLQLLPFPKFTAFPLVSVINNLPLLLTCPLDIECSRFLTLLRVCNGDTRAWDSSSVCGTILNFAGHLTSSVLLHIK